MTRIYATTQIRKPVDEVFEYVTTPAHWPEWHPSSLAVSGSGADHSGEPGEQVTEEFLVAGRRGRVVWNVTVREVPRRWTIHGVVEGGGNGTLGYTVFRY